MRLLLNWNYSKKIEQFKWHNGINDFKNTGRASRKFLNSLIRPNHKQLHKVLFSPYTHTTTVLIDSDAAFELNANNSGLSSMTLKLNWLIFRDQNWLHTHCFSFTTKMNEFFLNTNDNQNPMKMAQRIWVNRCHSGTDTHELT